MIQLIIIIKVNRDNPNKQKRKKGIILKTEIIFFRHIVYSSIYLFYPVLSITLIV